MGATTVLLIPPASPPAAKSKKKDTTGSLFTAAPVEAGVLAVAVVVAIRFSDSPFGSLQ